MTPYKISEEESRRIESLTHLRGAIMHIEAAMSLNSGNWTFEQVSAARRARDAIRNLGQELDT